MEIIQAKNKVGDEEFKKEGAVMGA